MKSTLLNDLIDHAVLYKVSVELTFKVSENKVSTLFTVLRGLFKKDEKWWVLTQSGMPVELEKIKSVVLK